MRYTITHCPNEPSVVAAVKRLTPPGYQHRKRGRGHRHGRYVGDVQYHESLPLYLSERFTVYGEPKDFTWRWPVADFARLRFVGLEGDRVRVRVLL